MSTDNLGANSSVIEAQNAWQPYYAPIFSIFSNVQYHEKTIGDEVISMPEVVGDVAAFDSLVQDTERTVFQIGTKSKEFRRFFKDAMFITHARQKAPDVGYITARALEAMTKQEDAMLYFGDGNNGLFNSNDADFITNDPITLNTGYTVANFAAAISAPLDQSKDLLGEGPKVIVAFGKMKAALKAFIPGDVNNKTYIQVMREGGVLDNVSIIEVPTQLEQNGVDGLLVLTEAMCKLHVTVLPQVENSGYNAEKKYYWYSYEMGSIGLECLAEGAVIKQLVTFA